MVFAGEHSGGMRQIVTIFSSLSEVVKGLLRCAPYESFIAYSWADMVPFPKATTAFPCTWSFLEKCYALGI